jgi:hypothetical protein
MGRPPPDPERVARAWELVIREGKSYSATAKLIAKEFSCTAPQPSTIGIWVQQGRKCVGYVRLMNVEDNRKRVAERYRELYGQAWEAYMRGGMTPDERAAMDAMIRIQAAESKLFGLDAAQKVMIEQAPPEVKESIVRAIAEMPCQDSRAV